MKRDVIVMTLTVDIYTHGVPSSGQVIQTTSCTSLQREYKSDLGGSKKLNGFYATP